MSQIQSTARVLTALAEARERFLSLARWLEAQPGVRKVTTGVDARRYDGGAVYVELFAEAELDTGNDVCWWLDLREAEGSGVLEPRVFVQHAAGQDDLATLAPREIRTDAEFRDVLLEVVTHLTSDPGQALQAALAWEDQ